MTPLSHIVKSHKRLAPNTHVAHSLAVKKLLRLLAVAGTLALGGTLISTTLLGGCQNDLTDARGYGDVNISNTHKILHLPSVPLSVDSAEPLGVILITVDTLRADYLSSYGNAKVVTPSFDRLASGGQLFKNAFAQASTTTPSHASLFTSLYLQDHNVFSNFEALGDDVTTLAEKLNDNCFSTFSIANMRHLNPEVSNLNQGIETYVKSGNMRRAESSIDTFLNWLDHSKPGETTTAPSNSHTNQTCLGKKNRFYGWLHLADVHTPYRPPAPYDRLYYDEDERDPAKSSLNNIWHLLPKHMTDHPFFLRWLEGITDLEWVYSQYQGAVTYVDDQIGRLMDQLEKRDLLHRTVIILTADHGEALGEHDMYFVHTGLYEPTVHVPLITYFPGAPRTGVQIDEVTELVDVMPTILDYFNIAPPEKIRGRSLWPQIKGQITDQKVALIEHAGRNLVALRSDKYKYIKHLRTLNIQPGYPFIAGKEELYNLAADPNEQHNIAKQHSMRPIINLFRQELAKKRGQKQNLTTGNAELTHETLEVLRALGYVR